MNACLRVLGWHACRSRAVGAFSADGREAVGGFSSEGEKSPIAPGMSDKAKVMPKPLLSTYRTGENRVTSSTMAVFERIDLALVQELLRAVTGMGSELQAVSFENQVTLAGS